MASAYSPTGLITGTAPMTGIGKTTIAGTLLNQTTSGGSGKKKTTSAVASAPPPSDEEVLGGYLDTLYAAYKMDPLSYEVASEDALYKQIEAWLRPSYERAILGRQKSTLNYRAELDADAISRGMGASTYVTDVKSRQMMQEAEDVAYLEGEYGATLAKTLSEQMAVERERELDVAKINQQNDYDAYMRAYEAALTMFMAYKSASGGGGGGGRGGSSGGTVAATSPENVETFLGMLSPTERKTVYEGSTAQGQQYKAEIIASVGTSGYYSLMGKYKSAV